MKRSTFIKKLSILPAGLYTTQLSQLKSITDLLPQQPLAPALFIGHGSPMNAVEQNTFTQHLGGLASQMETPKAILVISAHWLTRGTKVSSGSLPETIYDFGGFPDELYKIKYAAPGSPDGAKQTRELIKSTPTELDESMGLDHGAWTILRHIYPKANIPVFQLSIDYTKPPKWHYELATELRLLRSKGILIIGSGNIVHNLSRISFDPNAKTLDWAYEFDTWAKMKLDNHDFQSLIDYQKNTAAGIAVPTNDHYLPMLYTLGVSTEKEAVRYTFEGFQNGNISMRSFMIKQS